MTSKELVKRTLESWRFPVLSEEDNLLIFRYQMNIIQVGALEDDSHGVAVTLPGVFNPGDDRERRLAMKVGNKLTGELMQVKFYITDYGHLMISSEFFYHNDEDLEFLLEVALQSVIAGKRRFVELYEKEEEEDNFIRQINAMLNGDAPK